MDKRLGQALQKPGKSVAGLARAAKMSRPAVYHYLKGRDPPAQFVQAAADYLEVSVEWLYGEETNRLLYVVLGAETDEDQRAVDHVGLPDMTPTESQLFRSTLARWLKADPCPFPERVRRLETLAGYLEPPFGPLSGPRELTDYRVAQLHALGLAMPKRRGCFINPRRIED